MTTPRKRRRLTKTAPALLEPTFEQFTPAQVIDALKRSKGMIAAAARTVLHCARMTIYNMIKRHPEILEALREEREIVLDEAELKLFRAIQDGQPWAIAMILKTKGRHRGYVERTEVVKGDEFERSESERAKPLNLGHLSVKELEDLLKLLALAKQARTPRVVN